jgi:hypothetical protein
MHPATVTPTTVYWYADLIKKIPLSKFNFFKFKKQWWHTEILKYHLVVYQLKFANPCSRCKVIKVTNFKYNTIASQSEANGYCTLHLTFAYIYIYIYYYTSITGQHSSSIPVPSPQLHCNESNTNLFTHTTVSWNFPVCILQSYFHGACLASDAATAAILLYAYLQSGKITSSPSTYWILSYNFTSKISAQHSKIFCA